MFLCENILLICKKKKRKGEKKKKTFALLLTLHIKPASILKSEIISSQFLQKQDVKYYFF